MKTRRQRKERWESLCTRCGLCCYEKDYKLGRGIIDLSRPCPYLNEETDLCTVYERRFKTCRQCAKVRLFHAVFSSFMPESCGYVQAYRKWRFIKPAILRGGRRERRETG